MGYTEKGECRNTGKTHFPKGSIPWNKGLKGIYTEEQLLNLRVKARDRLLKYHPRKGIPLSDDVKEKIRKTLLATNKAKGLGLNNSYDNNAWRSLRKDINKRDGYKCQECFASIKGKNSHVHHVDFDPKNNNESNLISLCSSCHGKVRHKTEIWRVRYEEKVIKIIKTISVEIEHNA